MFTQVLGTAATVYGALGALKTLLQTRQMLVRRTSSGVSAGFLASYAGGYAIWLAYGLSTGSLPLIGRAGQLVRHPDPPSSIIALGRWTGRLTVRLVRLLYPLRLAQLAWRADTAGYLALVAAAIGAGYVWH
jgi:uncharacterized protein with PQ loop repeat